MRRLRNNNNGFSLIEVLIAIVVLTVGLLGTAALIIGVINANALSNRISTATVLAQDKMEDIKRIGYGNTVPEPRAPMPSPNDNYEMEVLVVPDPAADLETITVTVYWDAGNRQVELQTILAR